MNRQLHAQCQGQAYNITGVHPHSKRLATPMHKNRGSLGGGGADRPGWHPNGIKKLWLNIQCVPKSDAKIEITITATNLIRIKYPLSSFNYHLSGANVANFNKIHCTVLEQQLFTNGTQKQKFPIWKSRLSSLYSIPSVTICAQSGCHLQTFACLLCRSFVLCCCRTSCLQTL